MKPINQLLKKYALKPHRYEKRGKVTFVDTDQGRFVVKEKNRSENREIFRYLDSRSFHYYPKVLSDEEDDFELIEYIEPIHMPEEQKMLDMVDLVALLHNKTTHYKEVDEADYKQIYEDISNNIYYLTSYYNDMISVIENHVYMSPSEYLLARNISKIYAALAFCSNELDAWYRLIQEKRKQRFVVLHNNLDMSHFLRDKNSYLISWDKSKIGLPIFDLYKLYRRHALDYDFSEILKRYDHSYPMLPEEKKLFFILISLPDKIEFDQTEYEMCKKISDKMDFLYKTDVLLSPYYTENRK